MKKIKLREPINSLTHLVGAGVFFLATIALITNRIMTHASIKDILGVIVFGISLILLYLASGIYHGYNGSEKGIKVLKKLDHSMIYVLIAGSYTPICLSVLEGNKRIFILTIIWGVAIFGIFSKIYINNVPRVLYTFFYLLMGWMVVFFIKDLYNNVDPNGFNLLVLGGILYSIGGFIYMIKKPNISKTFGFHELFHLFILGGSLAHYVFVFQYLK